MSKAPARSACVVDANFGFLISPVWNGNVQARLFSDEQRRPGTGGRRHVRDASKPASILLLKDVEVAFATADIESLARGIVKQIVGVPYDVERAGWLPRGRVVHQDLGGTPAADKHTMVRLI